ncbi:FxSxx-COOH cyclophane-containing RiPP peptide [Streptosporangium sp. CA-135522]|uniref:FxSxx-COOH cyclophane-containing RiPP peptide n=1 Tax=Streptosporangium sp. CA-135522 TaxID=3240072 RepID=UPI003D8EF5D3
MSNTFAEFETALVDVSELSLSDLAAFGDSVLGRALGHVVADVDAASSQVAEFESAL